MLIGSSTGNPLRAGSRPAATNKVRVYLMRSAARRNKVANDRLEMVIV